MTKVETPEGSSKGREEQEPYESDKVDSEEEEGEEEYSDCSPTATWQQVPTSKGKPKKGSKKEPTLSFAKTQVRANTAIKVQRPEITKLMRSEASKKDYLMIQDKATSGMENKLDKIDYTELVNVNALDIFDTNENTESFVTEFKLHCTRFDMSELMTKFPVLKPEGTYVNECDRHTGVTVDLFEDWDKIGTNKKLTLDMIADTIEWIKKFADENSEAFLEDMDWVHHSLMKSVEPDLRSQIVSRLNNKYKNVATHGGPLTFALIIDECINLSEAAINVLQDSIVKFDLKSVPGEDVRTVVKMFQSSLKRLRSNNALPHDIQTSLLDVFTTSSVPEFNSWVTQWKNHLDITKSKVDYNTVLEGVLEKYKTLATKSVWTGVSSGDSSFNANDGKTKENPSNTTHNWSAPKDSDKVSDDPPRFERIIKERKFMYCAKCLRKKGSTKLGRWNTTHYTDQHRAPMANLCTETENDQGSGNQNGTPKDTSGSSITQEGKSFKSVLLDAQK